MLVPPRDPAALAAALEAVVLDPCRRSELSAASRSAATRFDVHRVADTLTARYEQLAGAPESPPRPPVVPAQRRDTWDVRPATADDRAQILSLLDASLGWRNEPRYHELFAWKHERNPFGPSLAWVVEDAGRVVAVRLFMRWEFRRGAATLRAVRAVDTATHPDHQGRGLFSALTQHALEACRTDGVAFVFNTPNAQSRPGYLKLGWREVGRPPTVARPARLRDLVAIARSRVPAERWSVPLDVGSDIATWLDGRGQLAVARHGVIDGPVVADGVGRSFRPLALRPRRPALPRGRRWRRGDRRAPATPRQRPGARRRRPARRPRRADSLVVDTLRRVGATHALRLGSANLRRGFVPVPRGGPILTWRAVCDHGPPPLPNWDLCLGDLELF